MKKILLFILILWGIPSTFFRNKFRKIIYETNDWKINFKPLFKKELIGLFSEISSKIKII
jgi:peroxiredoxin Q/BCP|tara:strand:- start:589 stop:768 length:180 start_codon:yes stop_codon:yes gene_type:complete